MRACPTRGPRITRAPHPAMPETVEAKEVLRPEARERVQDALAEVSALLRKHRLVEGLVHEQLEHTPRASTRAAASSSRASSPGRTARS